MEPCDTSCEPMDVDLSTNSITADISNKSLSKVIEPEYNEKEIPKTIIKHNWHFKKYCIKKKTTKNVKTFKILLSILVLCIAVVVYYILTLNCIDEMNLIDIRTTLEERLHDQTDALNKLLDALTVDAKSKVLFIYGGTGVGKTYTTSLLLKNVWNSSNVYHYTMPSFVDIFSLDHMFGINICKMSLVVVDDLKQRDIIHVKDLIKAIIKKSEDLNKKITIILVFNCDTISKDFLKECNEDFFTDVEKSFDDFNVFKKYIKYEPLTQNTLRKCIEDEVGKLNIGDNEMIKLLSNFNVSLDGCKGVHKKIKFLNLM